MKVKKFKVGVAYFATFDSCVYSEPSLNIFWYNFRENPNLLYSVITQPKSMTYMAKRPPT